MKIVDTIVKQTNSELADSGRVLQEILAAGANERGEWELPLTADKVTAMRAALDARAEHLNEVSDELCVYERCALFSCARSMLSVQSGEL